MTRLAGLAELLAGHGCEGQEAAHRQAMLELVEHGAVSLDRDHFVPGHFTASAFVLSPDATDLLLILHQKLGLWLQPGGHIEPEDTSVEHAARREVAEEVGLTELELWRPGIFDVDVHAIPALKSDPPHRHFDVRFAFMARDRRLAPASDALDARWVPLGEVAAMQSDASVMRAVARILATR